MKTGLTWITTINKLALIVTLITVISLGFTGYSNPQSLLTEVCDNAIDDDNDGLIDLNDPDCECEIFAPSSLIPNPSFEDLGCCPQRRSEIFCATGWIQASEPTTDFLHLCGWLGWDSFPPPQPFPDGEGILGFRDGRVRIASNPERNWKEHAGACLISPMLARITYRFEFYVGFVDEQKSPPINITFFGSTDCANLPFGVDDQTFGCPTNGPGWVELGSVRVTGNSVNSWILTELEITPDTDINAIVIGAPCDPTTSPEDTYYFFDNLVLADVRSFGFNIRPTGDPCSSDYSLSVPEYDDFSYQWYKDGIALPGETNTSLSPLSGDGNYQVRVDDGNICRVSLAYERERPVFSSTFNQSICSNESLTFGSKVLSTPGVYVESFLSAQGCDSIVTLNLSVTEQLIDTNSISLIKGESYTLHGNTFDTPGEYLVELSSAQGCDSLVFLQLNYESIYIPNVFSPNDDGINDVFKVESVNDFIQQVEIQIFDRWGALVFRGESWDGQYANGQKQVGVYVYVARVWLGDGKIREFWGDVAVVR